MLKSRCIGLPVINEKTWKSEQNTKYLHHHIPLVPSLAHRAEVIVFHSFRFVAKSCKSCVFRPIVFASLSIVLPSVSFGLPLFLLPFGDHMMVCHNIPCACVKTRFWLVGRVP
jgi:hypothetical protein